MRYLLLLLGLGLGAVLLLSGCGGPTPAGTQATLIVVTVTPTVKAVSSGGTQQFTASVTGTNNTAVTWSIQEANGGTINASGLYTAPAGAGTYHVIATSMADPSKSGSAAVTVNAVTHNLTNLFILHLSVGNGLIVDGGMRNVIAAYNTANSTQFVLWDHGYNADGLRDQHGNFTGTNYSIPSDDTTPWGLCLIWTSQDPEYVATRTAMMSNHQVIAFKSCFPASDIGDANTLQQYKTWYLAMRDFFDAHPEKLFIVMTTPPLHRLATNPTAAANARAFANWLSSSTYLSGHPNVRCFNLFDYLAKADDGTPTANMLRFEYELDDGSDDSHPNAQANAIVGPILAQFLCNAAREY